MAHWMICISTQQEVANLLPALTLGVERVVTLATSHAMARGWPGQLEHALSLSGVPLRVVELDASQERSPWALAQRVEALLAERAAHDQVTFSWAGGQKVQSAGLWMAYAALAQAQPLAGHEAIYVDALRGTLMRWRAPQDPKPQEERLALGQRLDLAQLLACSGLSRFEDPDHVQLWPLEQPLPWWVEQASALFHTSSELRRMCFALGDRSSDSPGERPIEERLSEETLTALLMQALETLPAPWSQRGELRANLGSFKAYARGPLSQRLRKLIVSHLRRPDAWQLPDIAAPTQPDVLDYLSRVQAGPLPQTWRAGGYQVAPGQTLHQGRFARLFEWLVMARVLAWAQANPQLVSSVHGNLKVCDPRSPHEVFAEFDVLIVDRAGRAIVLDAKSFTQDRQTERAQRYAASAVGGSFGRRLAVMAAYRQDIGQPSTLTPETQWGAQPWFPKALLRQLARQQGDSLLTLDETDSFERRLTQLCA